MDSLIFPRVGDNLVRGDFFEVRLLLRSIHLPLLKPLVLHYIAVILGMAGLHSEPANQANHAHHRDKSASEPSGSSFCHTTSLWFGFP